MTGDDRCRQREVLAATGTGSDKRPQRQAPAADEAPGTAAGSGRGARDGTMAEVAKAMRIRW